MTAAALLTALVLASPSPTPPPAEPPPLAACGHVHAAGKPKQVEGQQVHRKTNPHGRTYLFGTYERAERVRATILPTTDHTWFAGYAWSVLVCESTGKHIGWRFTGAAATFFALLIEEPPAPAET